MDNILSVPNSGGLPHRFTVYDIEETKITTRSGVYMFTQKSFNNDQDKFVFDIIYHGSSENLHNAIIQEKEKAIKKHCDSICILVAETSKHEKIEEDIKAIL